MKRTIFIVDDHSLIRYALKSVIAGEPDLEVCGEAEGAATAMPLIQRCMPALLMVDISLRGTSGLELIKSVRSTLPAVRILVMSMHAESIYGFRSLQAGAHGYCMKHEAAERLLLAIRKVLAGGVSVGAELASHMLHRLSRGDGANKFSFSDLLSDRELEVAALIGRGLTTQQIAIQLHVSVKTVETHRARIKEKLNLHNTTQLLRACVNWVEEAKREHFATAGAA